MARICNSTTTVIDASTTLRLETCTTADDATSTVAFQKDYAVTFLAWQTVILIEAVLVVAVCFLLWRFVVPAKIRK